MPAGAQLVTLTDERMSSCRVLEGGENSRCMLEMQKRSQVLLLVNISTESYDIS